MCNWKKIGFLSIIIIILCTLSFIVINSICRNGKEVTKSNYLEKDAIINIAGYERDYDHFTLTDTDNHYVTLERDYEADGFDIITRYKPKSDLNVHIWYMDYAGNVYYESDDVWKSGVSVFSIKDLAPYISLVSISIDSDFDAYLAVSYNYVNSFSYKFVALVFAIILLVLIVLYKLKKLDKPLFLVERVVLRVKTVMAKGYKNVICIFLLLLVALALSWICESLNILSNNYKTIFLFWAGLIVLYTTLFFKNVRNDVAKYTTFLIIVIGVLYSVLEPPCTGVSWDDETHFSRSIQLSHLFDNKRYLVNEISYNYYQRVALDKYSYKEEDSNNVSDLLNDVYREQYYTIVNNENNISRIVYFPSAVGIFISRGLELPFIISFIIGKIFSVLFYAALIYYAIKKLKYGKVVISLIAFIPTNMFLASNYSYDTWLTAWTILGLSYVFYEMHNKDKYISKRSMIIIPIAFCLAAMAKQIYCFMAIMAIFLSKDKFENKKRKWGYRLSIVFAMVLPFVLMYLQRFASMSSGDARGGTGVNSPGQIEYISNHLSDFFRTLFEFLRVYLNPIECHRQGNPYLDNFAYNGVMGVYWIVLLIIVAAALLCHGDEKKSFPVWYRLGIIAMYIGIGAICAVALYIDFTPVGADYIAGCQGRYIIPMLFPLIYVLSRIPRKTVVADKIGEVNISKILICAICFIDLFCIWKGCVSAY